MIVGRSHPKLFSRGSEVADSDLKFKGAPSDDCDPFAIQNYIDRLAAEVYDSSSLLKKDESKDNNKDEWELMKQKAKEVPFQDVTLSIALKHGLMEEVKKENANKAFEKESILAIMKVRDDFLRDYPNSKSFEYQWQIWVEWERYLKQIGVTIPQWGKIARKLIRLGVIMIQEDMTKKYSQISAGANKRKSEGDIMQPEGRKRRVSVPPPLDTSGFSSFQSSLLSASPDTHSAHASPYCTPMSTPVGTPVGTPVMTPHPIATNHIQMSPYGNPSFNQMSKSMQGYPANNAFGASLYTMIANHTTPGLFSTSAPSTPSTMDPMMMHSAPSSCNPSPIMTYDAMPYPPAEMGIMSYPYNDFITSSTSLPTVVNHHTGAYAVMAPTIPQSPLPSPTTAPLAPNFASMTMHYSPPPSPSQPMSTYASPMSTPPQQNLLSSSPTPTYMQMNYGVMSNQVPMFNVLN